MLVKSLRTAVLLGVSLVLSLSGLSACGGSDDAGSTGSAASADPQSSSPPTTESGTSPGTQPGTQPSAEPGAGGEPAFPLIAGAACDSTVTLTGVVEQSWTATGAVALSDSGPVATYQSDDGATVLTAYAAGNGFEQTFVVAVGLDTYAPAPGKGTLDVAADGSRASIDAVATGGSGDVHVTATITC